LLHNCLQVLAFLASEASASPEAVLGMCMRLGEVNFKVMALLDDAHTSRWELGCTSRALFCKGYWFAL
jgi:hypothetical protein